MMTLPEQVHMALDRLEVSEKRQTLHRDLS